MRKLIIFLTLFYMQNTYAERWVEIKRLPNTENRVYYDADTVHRQGTLVYIWVIDETSSGKDLFKEVYDCGKQRHKILYVKTYRGETRTFSENQDWLYTAPNEKYPMNKHIQFCQIFGMKP
jgi:hypothetical protein